MTPHNKAKKEDIARVVLMPGDPLRAKWIAETFLPDAKLVNEVRGMLAFTGSFQGKRVTVMGHGMGIPSVGIYSYELFKFYDVDAIIRVGSAGSYVKEIKVGDVIIAKDATSFSGYADELGVALPPDDASRGAGNAHDAEESAASPRAHLLPASEPLVTLALQTAKQSGLPVHTARAFSSDCFYNQYTLEENIRRSRGASVVEMEAYGLYANAIKLGKQALTLLSCSDSFITREELSADERQTKFNSMITLALAMAAAL